MMQPSEALCEVRRRDDEWCGWCPECENWLTLSPTLRDYGICDECREELRDAIWDRSDELLEEIMTKYQYCVPQTLIDEAADIRADMATVMGAHAAPDPRDRD